MSFAASLTLPPAAATCTPTSTLRVSLCLCFVIVCCSDVCWPLGSHDAVLVGCFFGNSEWKRAADKCVQTLGRFISSLNTMPELEQAISRVANDTAIMESFTGEVCGQQQHHLAREILRDGE